MMLTELPAIPALPAMDRTALVDRFPVFSLSRFTPSFPLLLTLLASLVIIASIRAAILFLRPLSKNAKAHVSVIPGLVQGQEKLEISSVITPSESSASPSSASSGSSKSIIVPASSASIPAPPPSPGSSEAQKPQTRRRWSSWGWGLVKWDTLPALPPYNGTAGGSSVNGNGNGNERWEQQQLQRQQQQRQPMMQHRRQFESPLPAVYQSEVPVSMAKMIMSRHTFRRPASRPPPVRNSNAPQYQRKMPSMV